MFQNKNNKLSKNLKISREVNLKILLPLLFFSRCVRWSWGIEWSLMLGSPKSCCPAALYYKALNRNKITPTCFPKSESPNSHTNRPLILLCLISLLWFHRSVTCQSPRGPNSGHMSAFCVFTEQNERYICQIRSSGQCQTALFGVNMTFSFWLS